MYQKFSALLRTAGLGLGLLFIGSGCERDDTDNISVIRTFPLLQLKGPTVTTIPLNGTFTDPGVNATLGGREIAPRISGRINTTVAGVYTLTYTVGNPEGDSLSVIRSIGVVDPSLTYPDLSGTYVRALTGGISVVTNLGNGLYRTDNLGAVPAPSGSILPAFFVQTSPTGFEMPRQLVNGNEFDFTSEGIIFGSTGAVESLAYIVLGPGFGTARRVFVKQ